MRAPGLLETVHELTLAACPRLPCEIGIGERDSSTLAQYGEPRVEERLGICKMKPRGLPPEHIRSVDRAAPCRRVLLNNGHEVRQSYDRCHRFRVGTPKAIA